MTGPDTPIESDNPFLDDNLINQNEQCWMFLKHKDEPPPAEHKPKDAGVKMRKHNVRKRENDENSRSSSFSKSPSRKKRPTSWLGVSLSQAPRPYTSKTEHNTHPSLIGNIQAGSKL